MDIRRIVYFGTAPIAVPALRAFAAREDVEVVAVCTQPDRPSGRKRRLTPSAVKVAAQELGLRVLDPEKIGGAVGMLSDLRPDLGVVYAYGQYLPSSVFDLPTYGSINFHPSRLPEYRGASPIQSALLDGKTESALSVIQVGREMDAGDIWAQREVTFSPEDTSETLHDRFGELAAEMVPDLLEGLRSESWHAVPQDESRVVECGKIQKADGGVDWSRSASELWNRVRAFQPWPGVFFPLGDQGNLKIHLARVETGSGTPGEVLDLEKAGPRVACGKDSLRLLRVQPPGKRPMSGADFLNGHSLSVGDVLPSAPERT